MDDDFKDSQAVRQQTLVDGFTVTWDHDFINLWCPQCPDSEQAVEFFAGNPSDLVQIMNAAIAHRAVMHGTSQS